MAEENLFDNRFDSKRCKVCGQFRPILHFKLDKRDGRRYGPCRPCSNVKQREYHKKNPEVQKRASARYYRKHLAQLIEIDPNTLRTCTVCKNQLSLSAFHKDTGCTDGYKPQCKACRKIGRVAYRDNPKAKEARKRAYQRRRERIGAEGIKWLIFKSKYGISQEDYERMLSEQNGKCAICFSSDPKSGHGLLVVDHCHSNGHVRGLLCTPCNFALGSMGDSIEKLESAIVYLKERGAPP